MPNTNTNDQDVDLNDPEITFGRTKDIPFVSNVNGLNLIRAFRFHNLDSLAPLCSFVLVLKDNTIIEPTKDLVSEMLALLHQEEQATHFVNFVTTKVNHIVSQIEQIEKITLNHPIEDDKNFIIFKKAESYISVSADDNFSRLFTGLFLQPHVAGQIENCHSKMANITKRYNEIVDSSKKTFIVEPTYPHIQLLSPTSLETLRILSTSSDEESNKRLKSLLSRIENESYTQKELATIPDGKIIDDVLAPKFPNFSELFDYLKMQFTLAKVGDSVFRLPPILLIGEPGIGKTEIMYRLSESMGSSFFVQDMASAQAGSTLTGSDIYWANSRHGELFNLLMFGKTANPIVMLDEIDKMAGDGRFSPGGGLYGLLERRSASKFNDLSMPGVHIDASHVVWVAAANDKNAIESALLSRFKVFDIPVPTKDQMPAVIKSIYSDLLARETWGKAFSPELSDAMLNSLDSVAPRQLRGMLEAACAIAVSKDRRHLEPEDIQVKRSTRRMGF